MASEVQRTIDVRLRIGMGDLALVRESFSAPIDVIGAASAMHHLQLSLLPVPRPISACYPERWNPRRFERMGAVFLLPAGSLLHARSECQVQQSLVCSLVPSKVVEWFGAELEWPDYRLVSALDVTSGEVRGLLFRIARELKEPGFGSEALIEMLIGQVCITLARQFRSIDAQEARSGLAPWRLRLIEERVVAGPGTVTLIELAGLCGLSVRHLARAFRIGSDQTLGELIAERRIDLARTMLAEGSSVKQTAFTTGFSAPTNFSTAFRRATGETPRQYRDRCVKMQARAVMRAS